MPGYNAQTYLEGFIASANLREINRTASDSISDTEILRRLNDGLAYCASQYKPTKVRRAMDLEEDEQLVLFPQSRLNMSITKLLIIREDNTQYPITRITEDEMELLYPVADTTRDTGEPAFWCFAENPGLPTSRNHIRIRPIPRWSKTNGVVFRYPQAAEQLWRVENTAGRLADFTVSSEYVYIYGVSGSDGVSLCRFGDEIGVCESSNLDGSTTSDPTVRVWYSIIESDIPTGTLTDLTTNGTFTGNANGWTPAAGAAYSANTVVFTGAGTLSQAQTGAVSGNFYRVDFTLSAASSPSLTVSYNGTVVSSSAYTTNGAKYLYFESGVADGVLLFTNASGNVTIDGVSCQAVTRFTLDRGAFQTATATRYIAAQVPDIEYSVPAGVGYAPVYWALHGYFVDMQQPQKAELNKQRAMEIINKFNQDEVGDQDDHYNPTAGMVRMIDGTTVTYWAGGYGYGSGYTPYWGGGWVQPVI